MPWEPAVGNGTADLISYIEGKQIGRQCLQFCRDCVPGFVEDLLSEVDSIQLSRRKEPLESQ